MKKIGYVLALTLCIALASCAKQQPQSVQMQKPPAVLVEEATNMTEFTLPKDIGEEDVQIVIASLLLYVPGVKAIATGPRTIIVWYSNASAENKAFLRDEVKRILKIKFEAEEIVFIRVNDYPDHFELSQAISNAVLNLGSQAKSQSKNH